MRVVVAMMVVVMVVLLAAHGRAGVRDGAGVGRGGELAGGERRGAKQSAQGQDGSD